MGSARTPYQLPPVRGYYSSVTLVLNKREPREHGSAADERQAHEHQVLIEFCKALSRSEARRISALGASELNSRTNRVDGNWIDGLVQYGSEFIAVEMVQFRPERDLGDVVQRDAELRCFLHESLQAAMRGVWLRLGYRLMNRDPVAPPPWRSVQAVPDYELFPKVKAELALLLEQAAPTVGESVRVRFEPASRCVPHRTPIGYQYLDKERFPVCAAHLESVGVQRVDDDFLPRVDASLNDGGIGFGEDELREQIDKKVRLSLKARQRAAGLPLWLLLHADGSLRISRIHDSQIHEAVEVLRRLMAPHPNCFDRVYLANMTGFLDVASVHRIV